MRFRLCQHQQPWMTLKGYYALSLTSLEDVYRSFYLLIVRDHDSYLFT